MTAARPWKNWNTPTVARMTPAKTVRPPAQAFLVPDAGPAVAGGLVVGDDVSAADGEVIGCFSFAVSGRCETAASLRVNRWWSVDVISALWSREPLIATGSRVGESLSQDTRYFVNEPDTRHRAEKAISSAPQMRDRPNQSVITVRPNRVRV